MSGKWKVESGKLKVRGVKHFIICAVLILIGFQAVGNGSMDTIRPPRPKIGLVLGGGGAKGAAHIGVLKYIEEIGLPIDYVVGTSMGSIIGGLYALGYSPDELQKLIGGINWGKYMSNRVNRRDISSADKNRRSSYLVTIPFNSGELLDKLKGSQPKEDDEGDGEAESESGSESTSGVSFISSLPSSFISGADLLNLFNSLCIGYLDPIDFNELPIPFACVATNLTTGEAAILRSGRFPEAIRASMAIPGIFSPVNIDGQLLADGGLVNNFPADICREMGADIIIGIEVAQGMIKDVNKLQSIPQLATQLKNIMVKGNTVENRKLCNVYFHPMVSDFGMLSFTSASIDTIVQRGYNHAAGYREQLLAIKQYMEQYGATEKVLQAPKAQYVSSDTLQLQSITMDNVNEQEFEWLLRKSKLLLNQPIPPSALDRAINIFKGTGHFSSIEYLLKPVQGPNHSDSPNQFGLHFKFHLAEPNNLSLGFNYNSEESAALMVNLGLGQNKFSGWRYNLTGRVGLNPRINSTITWAGISLANFNLSYDFQRAKYSSLRSMQYAALTFNRHRVRLYISEFHLRDFQANVGLESEALFFNTHPELNDANPASESRRMKNSTWGPYGLLTFDNMNHAYFATRGMKINVEIHERFSKRLDSPLTDISLALKYHFRVGHFVFIPQLYTRSLFGKEVEYGYRNIVGGDVMGRYYDYQLPFVGINNTTLAKAQTGILRLDLRYRLMPKHHITAIGNYMRSADNLGTLFSIDDEGIGHWGCGLRYSYSSPIGPISFDLHYSDLNHDWGSYFTLGYVF